MTTDRDPSARASAADNRAAFPALAALVDEIRARYPGARLLAGIEHGREVGRVDDELRALAAASLEPPEAEPLQDRLYRQYAEERRS